MVLSRVVGTRILSCVERRQRGMRSILCGLEPCGRDQNIKLCGTEAVRQEDIFCGVSSVAGPEY